MRKLFDEALKKVEDERADRLQVRKLEKYFARDDKGKYESKIADIEKINELSNEDLEYLSELLPVVVKEFVSTIKSKNEFTNFV